MSREKKFTQKIYYGYYRDSVMMSIPCPHCEKRKVHSVSCQDCSSFVGENELQQYIICSRKPKLLEALEKAENIAENKQLFSDLECFIDDPETHSEYWDEYVVRRDRREIISSAYGNQED